MRWRFWLKLAWIASVTLLLLISLVIFTPTPQSEVTGTLVFCMFILSFPLGWLSYAATTVVADHLGPIYHSRWLLTLTWTLFAVIGYVQWFIVIPAVFRVLRRLRGHRVI